MHWGAGAGRSPWGRAARHAAELIPGVRFAILPWAGHLSSIKQPERFASLIASD